MSEPYVCEHGTKRVRWHMSQDKIQVYLCLYCPFRDCEGYSPVMLPVNSKVEAQKILYGMPMVCRCQKDAKFKAAGYNPYSKREWKSFWHCAEGTSSRNAGCGWSWFPLEWVEDVVVCLDETHDALTNCEG